MKIRRILANALQRYFVNTPTLHRIQGHIIKQRYIPFDHVAFRSFRRGGGGIDFWRHKLLTTLHPHVKYIEQESLTFPTKHLNAVWFKPTIPSHPRIFISELDDSKLSIESQDIITQRLETHEYPNYKHYQQLVQESEYAAWTYIFGSEELNHATIPVHAYLHDLESFHKLLIAHGVKLNKDGGVIKTSDDGKLHQSSTLADTRVIRFSDNTTMRIPGSFVEFVQRDIICEKSGERRDGFEANNAIRIFSSTNVSS